MKKTISALLLGALLSVFLGIFFPAFAADTYKADLAHSTILFRIKHLGMTNVHGRFNDFEGAVTLDEKNPANNSITITIKASSIDTSNEKRDTHLRSADFFDVNTYPTISFTSKSCKAVEQDVFQVSGDLDLHGVRQPISVELERTGAGNDPWGGYRMGFETEFQIKRSDFGMKHSLGSVGDEVLIEVSLEAVRQ